MKEEPSIWRTALVAAALGLLLGLREARNVLVVPVLRLNSLEALPRPRSTDWIVPLRAPVLALGRWEGLLGVAGFALGAWLLVRLAHELNPGGSLTRAAGATASTGPWYHRPLDTRATTRIALAAAASFYLCGGFGWLWESATGIRPGPLDAGLTGAAWLLPGGPLPGLLLAFLLGGAILWLLWGEAGVLRAVPPTDGQPPATNAPEPRQASEDPSSSPPVSPSPGLPVAPRSGRGEIAARGALAGLIALPLLLPFTAVGRATWSALLGTLSATEPRAWFSLAGGLLLWWPVGLVLLVAITRALGRPGLPPSRRLGQVVLPALAAAVVAAAETTLFDRVLVNRYDLGRPREQALTGLAAPREARAYLVFAPAGPAHAGLVPYGSIQNIAAGPENERRAWEHLRSRGFQSRHARDLFVHLYDSAALEWDSAGILRVCVANLEQNPEQIFGQLLLEKLASCAITPETRAALDRIADPARYRFDGPSAPATLAALYRRFGDLERARSYERGASATPDRGPAPLTDGVVTGRILIDGQPMPGLRVGLVPAAQATTLPGRPRPFEHRWIAAAAGAAADGGFRITHVGEGDYLLIVMADARDLRLRRPAVDVTHPPRMIFLDRRHPTRDLGTINARLDSPPAPTFGA